MDLEAVIFAQIADGYWEDHPNPELTLSQTDIDIGKPQENGGLPSGDVNIAMETTMLFMGKLTISMAIFHSKLLTSPQGSDLKSPTWVVRFTSGWN